MRRKPFRVELPYPVWRCLPDHERSWLALEMRDAKAQQAWFGVINLETGHWLWDCNFEPEPWLASLLAVGQGVLVLQGLHSPQLPIGENIWVLHGETGHALWQAPGFRYVGLMREAILAEHAGHPEGLGRIALQTGTLEWAEPGAHKQVLWRKAAEAMAAQANGCTVFPALAGDVAMLPHAVRQFVGQMPNHPEAANQMLLWLTIGEAVVVSLQTELPGGAWHEVLGMATPGSPAQYFDLAASASGPAPDTFFALPGYVVALAGPLEMLILPLASNLQQP